MDEPDEGNSTLSRAVGKTQRPDPADAGRSPLIRPWRWQLVLVSQAGRNPENASHKLVRCSSNAEFDIIQLISEECR